MQRTTVRKGSMQTGTAQTGTAQTGTAQTGTAQTGSGLVSSSAWRRSSVLVFAVAIAIVGAACSSSRGPSTTGATGTNGASGASTTAPAGQAFGTLPSPCGPGSAKGATEQGVTDTAIHIAYGDDAGFAQSPGLNHELSDGMKGMIKWCDDQGGILGRQVVGDYYDAAITQTNTVMQQACKTDFMLVGEGWALDDGGEQTRVACNLVATPGFAAEPNFANGPEVYQPVPNPDDDLPASEVFQAAKLFPDQVKKATILHTTLSVTESSSVKVQEAGTAAGFNWLDCGVKINYFGEPSYVPFAQKMKSCGAALVFINVAPGPVLYNFIQAMDQVGFHPIILGETDLYTPEMSAWNTANLANNLYVRDAFQPVENASLVPAVKQFIDAVKAVNGKADQLGEQSASAFLLWATEAKACGSNLTRQCMVNNLSKVHSWDGGGLHAVGDPGANLPPKCGMLVKLTGTTWSQNYPTTQGQLDCQDQYLFKVSQANWGTTLGADRIATKFLSATVIKPQP